MGRGATPTRGCISCLESPSRCSSSPSWASRSGDGLVEVLREGFPFDEVETLTLSDGARIVLGSTSRPRSDAALLLLVILCHGLAMNRHAFALDPERSLAARLAAEGRDVWVLELRGASNPRNPNAATHTSTFDSYVGGTV